MNIWGKTSFCANAVYTQFHYTATLHSHTCGRYPNRTVPMGVTAWCSRFKKTVMQPDISNGDLLVKPFS